MSRRRATGAEGEARTVEALRLLQLGRSASGIVSELAVAWGVSERQAARYVSAAKRRVSWAVAGESLAQPLHQALSAVQDLATSAAAGGDLREANKAWATFAALLKSAGRLDPYSVWEAQRDALGVVTPPPYPEAPELPEDPGF